MTDQPDTPPEDTPDHPTGSPPPDAKPDTGRDRALAAEREARRDAERRAREAQERADELERAARVRTIAADKGLSDAQAAFLGDGTEEEMAARADELLAAFKPADDDTYRRPHERLRSGSVPSVEPPPDLGTVADRIMRD